MVGLMVGLSVAIVARDEEGNLGRVLESVRWAREIVVVDSGSRDGTVALAERYGAKVFYRAWEGYGRQVNRALDLCSEPWILNLDADEVVSGELAEEIQALLSGEPAFAAYTVPRLNQIFGRWMRHGGLYPDRKLRLFRKGWARLEEDTEPHATPKFLGGAGARAGGRAEARAERRAEGRAEGRAEERVGALRGELLHRQYPDLHSYIEHMDRYSSASVPLLVRRGKTSRNVFAFVANVVGNPLLTFVYNYVVRGGFLDGREGLLFHLSHAMYVNWKYAKAWRGEASGGKLTASGPSGESREEQIGFGAER